MEERDYMAEMRTLKTDEARMTYLTALNEEERHEAWHQFNETMIDLWEKLQPFVKAIVEWRRRVIEVFLPILEELEITKMKLHLGCGSVHKPGYVNVDIRNLSNVDVVCDITHDLPWDDDSCECIETYHVVEHLPRRQVAGAFMEWHRVLQAGSVLVVEVPNFDIACREYLAGNDERLNSIFGRQRWEGDAHLFGYNAKRLTKMLEDAGFSDIVEFPATTRRSGGPPCIRLEAIA